MIIIPSILRVQLHFITSSRNWKQLDEHGFRINFPRYVTLNAVEFNRYCRERQKECSQVYGHITRYVQMYTALCYHDKHIISRTYVEVMARKFMLKNKTIKNLFYVFLLRLFMLTPTFNLIDTGIETKPYGFRTLVARKRHESPTMVKSVSPGVKKVIADE